MDFLFQQEIVKLREMVGTDHEEIIRGREPAKRQRHDSFEGINDSFEVRNLRSEVARLQADCDHWKALANGVVSCQLRLLVPNEGYGHDHSAGCEQKFSGNRNCLAE